MGGGVGVGVWGGCGCSSYLRGLLRERGIPRKRGNEKGGRNGVLHGVERTRCAIVYSTHKTCA